MWGLFVYKRDRFFGEVGGDECFLATNSYVGIPRRQMEKVTVGGLEMTMRLAQLAA